MVIGVIPDISTSNKRAKKSSFLASPTKEEVDHIVMDWDVEREKNELATVCLELMRLCIKSQSFEINYK